MDSRHCISPAQMATLRLPTFCWTVPISNSRLRRNWRDIWHVRSSISILLLLDRHANMEAKLSPGRTLLHMACRDGRVHIQGCCWIGVLTSKRRMTSKVHRCILLAKVVVVHRMLSICFWTEVPFELQDKWQNEHHSTTHVWEDLLRLFRFCWTRALMQMQSRMKIWHLHMSLISRISQELCGYYSVGILRLYFGDQANDTGFCILVLVLLG